MFHASDELKREIISNRRELHRRAEIGFDLPETRAFILRKLREYGYEPVEMGGGITCTVGEGEKRELNLFLPQVVRIRKRSNTKSRISSITQWCLW